MCWQQAFQWPRDTAISLLPQLSTIIPWTLLSSTFWPCKLLDTWMKINLHKSSTPSHSIYHLSIPFWFVAVPCHFWLCKTSLHHPSQTSSASCLSLFLPHSQHHGTFYPTAIQIVWLLIDLSMNVCFYYSHTHIYTPSLSHKYLVLSLPNPLFSLFNKLKAFSSAILSVTAIHTLLLLYGSCHVTLNS